MKASKILKKLSWSMTLPFGINIRFGAHIVEAMNRDSSAHYESEFYIDEEKWYLEIIAPYESSALMKEFQYPDSIIMMYDGGHLFFEIKD